jgi:tetratricopeptide (TPR) repeat protein
MWVPVLGLLLGLQASPDESLLGRADQAIQARDVESGEKLLLEFLNEANHSGEAYAEAGALLLGAGYAEKAQEHFRAGIERDPSLDVNYLGLTQALQALGKEEQVRQAVRSGLQALPGHPALAAEMARMEADAGDFQAAISVLESVADENRGARFWELLGRLYLTDGDDRSSFRAYRQALELDSNSISVLRALAGLALRKQDLDEAWEYMAQARRLAPNSPQVLLDFAQVSIAAHLPTEAVTALRLLLLLEPEEPEYQLALGKALLHSDDNRDAHRMLRRYVDARPDDADARTLLGFSLYLVNEFEEALLQFNKALAQDPNQLDAVYYQAMIAYARAEDERAEELFLEVLRRAPSHGEAYLNLAKLHFRQNRADEARGHLEKAAALLPREPDVHFQMSRLYAHSGDRERAAAAIQRYRELKAARESRDAEARRQPFTFPKPPDGLE